MLSLLICKYFVLWIFHAISLIISITCIKYIQITYLSSLWCPKSKSVGCFLIDNLFWENVFYSLVVISFVNCQCLGMVFCLLVFFYFVPHADLMSLSISNWFLHFISMECFNRLALTDMFKSTIFFIYTSQSEACNSQAVVWLLCHFSFLFTVLV